MKTTKKTSFQALVKKQLEKTTTKTKNNENKKTTKTKNENKKEIVISNEIRNNTKLGKIKLYENENEILNSYLFNENGKLNKKLENEILQYNKLKKDFTKILKSENKKDILQYKKQIEKYENDKNFNIILQYLKINSINDKKDILKDIEYENIKKDYILNLCSSKKQGKKVKNLNKNNIKKYIQQKINKSKNLYIKNDIENENIFGNSENFNINFMNKINNKYIIEKINEYENEKIKDITLNENMKISKNKLNKLNTILNDKIMNINNYKKVSITLKDKINIEYNYVINSCNRIYNKYVKRYCKENENIKENILNIYTGKLEKISEYENKLNNEYEIYHNKNTNYNNKLNRLKAYFINEYGIFYMDYLFNNLHNKYKKGIYPIL